MKYVREHINEKFSDESDPIHDMNIGYKENFSEDKFIVGYDRSLTIRRNKMIKKLQKDYENKLRKKLIGKTISGIFRTTNGWEDLKRTFKIKNVIIELYNAGSIDEIYLISDKGKKYRMLSHRRSGDYTLTIK